MFFSKQTNGGCLYLCTYYVAYFFLILMVSKETLFVPMMNTIQSVKQSGTFLNFFGDSTVVVINSTIERSTLEDTHLQ